MTKINLNATKLGQVRFSKDSFSVPNFGTVVSARASVKRDENGKPIPNSIAKIQLELVNSKTLNMILQDGGDIADLATFSAEVVAEEAGFIDKKENVGTSGAEAYNTPPEQFTEIPTDEDLPF